MEDAEVLAVEQGAMDHEQQRPPQPAHVQAFSLKLSPYCSNDIQIWFAQVEAQFATHGMAVNEQDLTTCSPTSP